MMLLTATTTELSKQEQKRDTSSSSDSISTATAVAGNHPVPASQTGGATSKIDWSAIVRHLSGSNAPAQFVPLPMPMATLTPAKPGHIRVLVEVTDPNEENRELVQDYLQTVAQFGVGSHEASEAFRSIAEKFRPYIFKKLLWGGKYNLEKEDAEDIAQEVLTDLWDWLNGYLLSNAQSDGSEGEEQKKDLGNFAQIIRIIIRNRLANWLQHQYRLRAKKQGSTRVTNPVPLKFVSLHHVSSSHVLTSRIRDFGRELELSSHYSEAVSYAGSRNRDMSGLIDQLYDAGDCIEPLFEQRELLTELAVGIARMKRSNPHYVLVLMEQVRGKSYRQIADENNWTLDQVKKYLSRARKWLVNYFATAAAAATITTAAAATTSNESENKNDSENEKESPVASGSESRAEPKRKKVKKSKPRSSTEEWQAAAD